MNAIFDRIETDLSELTSVAAAGRLAGSEGARFAARHLASRLAEDGIEPAGQDDYFTPVTVMQSRLTSKPRLIVNDVELTHRQHFALREDFSKSADAHGKLQVISSDRDLAAAAIRDRFLFLTDRVDGRILGEIALVAREEGARGILIPDRSGREWLRKSVRVSSQRLPVVSISPMISAVLEKNENVEVQLQAELDSGEVTCSNVLGMIRGGAAREQMILLAAHYDHVGDDPDGRRYPGAFDNASGVAVVMAAARELTRRRASLRTNVVVALLTGEESGFWGARALVRSGRFAFSAAVNVDGVGSESLRAVRIGDGKDTINQIAARVLPTHGVQARFVTGTDDSSVFRSASIPTVGFGQEPLGRDLSFTHSPDDHPEALDRTALATMVGIVTEVVEVFASTLPTRGH